MGINFPTPAENMVYEGYVFRNSAWRKPAKQCALPKNFIVNPVMAVSQQNGSAAGTVTGYYPADQWTLGAANGAATFSIVRAVPSVRFPSGEVHVIQLTGTSTTAMTTSGYSLVYQNLEGIRTADFGWGTAKAKPVVLRFTAHSNVVTPTWAVSIVNDAADSSFISTFTIPSTGTFYTYEVAIPPPPTGAWATNANRSMFVAFCTGAGATYQGVPGWQSGYKFAVAGQSSIWDASGNYLRVGEIGLYLDPLDTGRAPKFQIPEITAETRRCQRYWYKQMGLRGGIGSGTVAHRMGGMHPAPMRVIPAGAIVGSPRIYDAAATPIMTSLATVCNEYNPEFDITCSAGGFAAGGRAGVQYVIDENSYIAMSARM